MLCTEPDPAQRNVTFTDVVGVFSDLLSVPASFITGVLFFQSLPSFLKWPTTFLSVPLLLLHIGKREDVFQRY